MGRYMDTLKRIQARTEAHRPASLASRGYEINETNEKSPLPPLSPPPLFSSNSSISYDRYGENGVAPKGVPADTPVAVDLETVGLGNGLPLPWHPGSALCCVGFALDGRRFAFQAGNRTGIQAVLRRPGPKIFHHAGYDLVWLLASGFEVAGPVHDTLWPIAFQNGTAAKGLKAQGPAEYPVYLPKDFALFPQLVREYCANDAVATLALYSKGSRWHGHRLYALYSRLALRIARLCTRGLPLFADRTKALYQDTTAQREALHRELIVIKPITWTSPKQVARYLGIPSTEDAALAVCAHPAAPILRKFRSADKLLTAFLRKFHRAERVHGLISLGGSRIGRTSSNHINLQNIPKDRAVRRLFGTPSSLWLQLDFAQAELVVAAVLAECRPLLDAFREGRDPHLETASRIFGVSLTAVTREQRALGKLLNFALLYGAGVGKVVEQADLNGIALTVAQAAEFRNQWFRAYPKIRAWQDRIRRRLFRGNAITSAFGRRWSIDPTQPRGWNQALQAPVASTASDLLLLGLDAVWDRLEAVGAILNLVHDEIDVLIPADTWADVQSMVRDLAITMAGIDPRFPMRVEVGVGPTWGETIPQFVVGGEG